MPKTKMERIAFAPLRPPQQLSCAHGRLRIQAVAASSLIKLAGLRDVPEGSEPVDGILRFRILPNLAKEFGVLVRILRRMLARGRQRDRRRRAYATAGPPQPYSQGPVIAIEPFPLICSAC